MMVKLLGFNWRASSKEEVLELLKKCIGTEHGGILTCPLCQHAEVNGGSAAVITQCKKCILPGEGNHRCNHIYRLFKKAGVEYKGLKIDIFQNEIYWSTSSDIDKVITRAIELIEKEIKNEKRNT